MSACSLIRANLAYAILEGVEIKERSKEEAISILRKFKEIIQSGEDSFAKLAGKVFA